MVADKVGTIGPSEARRADTYLRDPTCVGIYDAIDYDYVRSFGRPDDSHPMRSRIFDDAVAPWLASHPGGTVVELASGLETQFQRLDDGQVRWLCVDVPEAISVRERFLKPTDRYRHCARSALDRKRGLARDGASGDRDRKCLDRLESAPVRSARSAARLARHPP